MPLPVMNMPKILDDTVIFAGGLDLKTPNVKLKPGHVRSAQNWQCVVNEEGGGYERSGGYERFANTTPPSSGGAYSVLVFSSFVTHPLTWSVPPGGPPQEDYPASWEQALVINHAAFGSATARAKVVYYVDNSITDYYEGETFLIVQNAVGTFQVGETVYVPVFDTAGNLGVPFTVGVITSVALAGGITARRNAQFLNLMADSRRQWISAVPGSGPVLGVASAVFGGTRQVYAFRNTEDGTQAKLYQAVNRSVTSDISVGEWQEVTLYNEVRFAGGGPIDEPLPGVVVPEPLDGSVLNQDPVSATIKRVVHESGSWQNGTAAGRLIVTTPSPSSFSADVALIGDLQVTLLGAQTPITLLPNGRYQCKVFNFGGQLSSRRLYGVDGANRGFEFDGDVFVPIETKAPQDTPKYLAIHHFHLVFMIGSSLMGAGPGLPYKFNAATGGFEIPVGDEITGALVQPGNQDTAALAVFGRNSTGVLYGTSAADFNFKALATNTGAIPYMQANLGESYVLDDRGVMSLAAGEAYGNFRHASLTANIDTYLSPRRPLSVGCCVSVDRSQLRLFFSDGSALYLTIVNGKLVGALPQFFPDRFSCVWSAEDASGNEETFAGAQNGFVYQLDRGSSFDGEPIEHHLTFTPNFMKAPRIKKQFRNGSLEVQSSFFAEFSVGYNLSYSSTKIFQPEAKSYESDFAASSAWDSFVWDNFVWDGVTLSPSEVEIKGKSEAIQMMVSGSSDYIYPFTLSSLITHFNYTRRTR